jgi:phosphatidylglycerol:prolipoprotein diacylglycerol transferase
MTAALGFWVHDLDPVAFRFPAGWPLGGVHWYGLAYAAGFLVGAWLIGRWRRAGVAPLRDAHDESVLMTALMVGVVGGGRLGHVLLYARQEFVADPAMVFRVWQGGMASHGGFLGVLLACVWFARSRRVTFLSVGDLVCAAAPAGILFGRLANFVNAELVGRVTDVPWAVVFPREGSEPRHPSARGFCPCSGWRGATRVGFRRGAPAASSSCSIRPPASSARPSASPRTGISSASPPGSSGPCRWRSPARS